MIIDYLNKATIHLLNQLEDTITQLSDEQFRTSISLLGGSSIGEHIRHILEFYIELYKGLETGVVNYNDRQRDHELQTIRSSAIFKIKTIINALRDKEDLNLDIVVHSEDNCQPQLRTNYAREMMYNLDHTIHHMALIRIGISLVSEISLPTNFGVAKSTIQFREACAR